MYDLPGTVNKINGSGVGRAVHDIPRCKVFGSLGKAPPDIPAKFVLIDTQSTLFSRKFSLLFIGTAFKEETKPHEKKQECKCFFHLQVTICIIKIIVPHVGSLF